MDPAKAKLWKPEPFVTQHTSRDTIFFALGVGASLKTDLHFLYENHDNFQVFPTFVINPGLRAGRLSDAPGVDFKLQNILHGEQYIELFEPLPDDGELRCETEIVDILDKKSSAVILSNVLVYDNRNGKKLAKLQSATVQMGSGGFGGPRSNSGEIVAVPVPQRAADHVAEEPTTADQAALYRLGSMDLNPLHVDPAFAKMGGFKQPILHGMCTLGVSTRAVLRDFGKNDARNFKAVKARFSAPVLPGQTLLVEMWKGEQQGRVHFQTKASSSVHSLVDLGVQVKETGKVVISSAYVDFHSVHGPKL
ncbi:Enoyl-CoA hydratase [Aphelenchoides fujianensis]|nr:Enoyl-CoA hydratase [Aphelenchoides fujianensis]